MYMQQYLKVERGKFISFSTKPFRLGLLSLIGLDARRASHAMIM